MQLLQAVNKLFGPYTVGKLHLAVQGNSRHTAECHRVATSHIYSPSIIIDYEKKKRNKQKERCLNDFNVISSENNMAKVQKLWSQSLIFVFGFASTNLALPCNKKYQK